MFKTPSRCAIVLLACSLVATLHAAGDTSMGGRAAKASRRSASQVQEDLERLDELLSGDDILGAMVLRESIQGVHPRASALVEQLEELDERLKDLTEEQQVERGEGYLWARNPAVEGSAWSKAADRARSHLRNQKNVRIAALRIRLEKPDHDEQFYVTFRGLTCYRMSDDGYGGAELIESGDFILAGGRESVSEGEIEIQTLRHACPSLEIELPEDGVDVAGEVLIRAAPADTLGSLKVQVVPESGVLIEGAMLRVGRRFAPYQGGTRIGTGGSCTLAGLAEGSCELYVYGKDFCSQRQRIEIKRGRVSKVSVPVYGRRGVTIDWMYRFPAGEGDWEEGTTTVTTGSSAPLNLWGQNGSVYSVSDWDGKAATIRPVNGRILPAKPADFDAPRIGVRASDWQTDKARQAYTLEEGKVFAVQYGSGARKGEALMRIGEIKPLELRAAEAEPADE
jgi:hypothetical protein